MRFAGAVVAALCVLTSCANKTGDDWPRVPLAGERVSVMTFNVQNLFDTTHDLGKLDHTYLPLARKKTPRHRKLCARLRNEYRRDHCLNWDWSEELLEIKLSRLAAAILQVGGGRGPDILVLQEVENAGVLERLRRDHLKAAGYGPGLLIEGKDPRGIDAAILTRLKSVGRPLLHSVPFPGMGRGRRSYARGILEAELILPGGEKLTVFALHLPAPSHPWTLRAQGLRRLNALLARLPAGRMAVAAGDFNIPYEEDLEHRSLEKHARPWLISHLLGCAGCLGSSYYGPKDEWSFLDMILLSKNLHPRGGAGWVVLRESVRLADGAAHQKHRDGTPARFDPYHKAGVSDHYPVVLELAKRR